MNKEKPGKSLALVISFLKLTNIFLDLDLESDSFIESIMYSLCLLIMKVADDPDH